MRYQNDSDVWEFQVRKALNCQILFLVLPNGQLDVNVTKLLQN